MGNVAGYRRAWQAAAEYRDSLRRVEGRRVRSGEASRRATCSSRRWPACSRRDPRAQPLLSRRRDGDDDRHREGVRLQDRARSTTRSRPTRSATCWPRTTSARACGPTGGASRSRPTTASARTSRWSTRRRAARSSTPTIANGIQRLNQEAAKAHARRRWRPGSRSTAPTP